LEDLQLAATCEGHLQGIQTELRVKAVRELPTEYVPGEEINHSHQIEEAFAQRM
jgi:hypothetical protein